MSRKASQQTLDWEDALKNAGDDFYIVTKYHRGMVQNDFDKAPVPRQSVLERSLVKPDGKTLILRQTLFVVVDPVAA